MTKSPSTPPPPSPIRCAVYTRKSTEEGLSQDFNSLDAQRESAEFYIQSQDWTCLPDRYDDDGGYTGANTDRPGERVLDLFGGSGSTLISAEQEGRKARLMEIDPAYCDVIVTRWENFTGKKAAREAAPVSAAVGAA